MNYFEALSAECDKLTEKANEYLSRLPFMPNDKVAERLWEIAIEIGKKNGLKTEENYLVFKDLNWEILPEWVANTLDGWLPYGDIPRNGSLHFSLGFSSASQDAHLRNLLEIAEGRETNELDFPVVVPKDFWDKLEKENPLTAS